MPHGLWSNEQKGKFKKDTNKKLRGTYFNSKSELVKDLKKLAPDSTKVEETDAQKAEKIGGRIKMAFPDYEDKDINGVGEALVGLVDGTAGIDEMRGLYQKLLPINRIPDNIEDMREDILIVIEQYYTLIGQ